MVKIFINTLTVLLRKKEFILVSTIIPAIVTVCLSFIMGQTSSYNIGIIDRDKSFLSENIANRLDEIEGVNVVEVKEEKETSLLLRDVILVVEIKKGFYDNILKENWENDIDISFTNNSEVIEVSKMILKEEIKGYNRISAVINGDEKKFVELLNKAINLRNNTIIKEDVKNGIDVSKSLGIIIMFIFFSSSLITRYIILENKKGTKGRIIASGVSKLKYNLAILAVFYCASASTSIFYYGLCRLLGFDFGMKNSIDYFTVLLFVNLLAVSFNLFIGSLVKKPEGATNLNIIIIVPLAMLSGCFWEFNFMGENLQKIGNMIPLRWAILGVERLQRGETIDSLRNIFLLFIVVSIILVIGSRINVNE